MNLVHLFQIWRSVNIGRRIVQSKSFGSVKGHKVNLLTGTIVTAAGTGWCGVNSLIEPPKHGINQTPTSFLGYPHSEELRFLAEVPTIKTDSVGGGNDVGRPKESVFGQMPQRFVYVQGNDGSA